MLITESGCTCTMNDGSNRGSNRERGRSCGKTVIWLRKQLNVFGGPGWYRSLEKYYKEEGERVIDAAPLSVCTGAVDSDG